MSLLLNFVVMFVFVSKIMAESTYRHWPTAGCTSESRRLTCHVILPDNVPLGIKDVVLQDLTASQLNRTDCAFCNNSWGTVQKLTIQNGGGNSDSVHYLKDHQFRGLSNLVSLTLSLSFLYSQLPSSTFAGLDKLTTLDMSNCLDMSTTNVFQSLTNPTILPKLSKFILHNIYTINDNTNLITEQMCDTLSNGRNITELDISDTRIMYPSGTSGIVFYPLCETLKVLNISNIVLIPSGIDIHIIKQDFVVCKSLETLDVGGFHTYMEHIQMSDMFIINKYRTMCYSDLPQLRVFDNVRTLYARETFHAMADVHIYLHNYVINLTLTSMIKHLYFSKNRIKWLDGMIISDYIRLETLDLSNNDMEYVAPRLFQQSMMTSLTKLDLSYNMLNHMESNETELEILFSGLVGLETLDLSHNNISHIPGGIFVHNTKLSVVNLSNNRLTLLTFAITSLTELKFLDIGVNYILHLDYTTINNLNFIYTMQLTENATYLRVNMHINPLQCSSCADMQSVKWVATSPVVVTTSDQYTCEDENGKIKPINKDTMNYTQYLCDRTRIILMATIIPTVSIALIILTIVCLRKHVKNKRIRAHVVEVRRAIENNAYRFRYPIFLSFSSNDGDVVLRHLHPELQHQLQTYCRTDRELVCIGDRHFRAGHYIADETTRCLKESGLLVVVLSENYCNSDWCRYELEQAHQLHMPMLIIYIEDVDVQDMSPVLKRHFQNNVRVKFSLNADGDYVITPFWDNVCFSILILQPTDRTTILVIYQLSHAYNLIWTYLQRCRRCVASLCRRVD